MAKKNGSLDGVTSRMIRDNSGGIAVEADVSPEGKIWINDQNFNTWLKPKIARALDAIGDWWSLLIVRDAMGGKRRFGEFQKSLGLAKNILTVRLRKLVDVGIMVVEPASDGSAYKEYVLTEKGERLHAALVALRQWGEAFGFAPYETAPRMMDVRNGRPLPPLLVVAEDRRTLGPRDIGLLVDGDGPP